MFLVDFENEQTEEQIGRLLEDTTFSARRYGCFDQIKHAIVVLLKTA